MAICSACALVQLSEHPSASEVAPRVPWIVYNEPDGHLDAALAALRGSLGAANKVMGVGPFDGPLLDRLPTHGQDRIQLDLLLDVAPPPGTFPYLETLQAQLQPARLAERAAQSGTADIVVCRYLLEHSHAPVASLKGLGALLGPNGRLVIEVPDGSKFLEHRDYSYVWEEHVSYFTEPSLRRCLALAGYRLLGLYRAAGSQEDLLVAVACRGAEAPSAPQPEEFTAFTGFAADFPAIRRDYQAAAGRIMAQGGNIAILGVGHQAVMFMNALGLAKDIAVLADDHPDKVGTFAPGSVTPITTTAVLDDALGVTACLLSTSPRIEAKVRARLGHFLGRGGQIYSIFPGIDRPTLIEPAG